MEEGCARWLSFENNGPLCPLGGGSSQAVIWFPFYNRVLLDSKPQACVGRLGLWRACPPPNPILTGRSVPFSHQVGRRAWRATSAPILDWQAQAGRHRLAGTPWASVPS